MEETTLPAEYSISSSTSVSIGEASSPSKDLEALPLVAAHEETSEQNNETREALSQGDQDQHESVCDNNVNLIFLLSISKILIMGD